MPHLGQAWSYTQSLTPLHFTEAEAAFGAGGACAHVNVIVKTGAAKQEAFKKIESPTVKERPLTHPLEPGDPCFLPDLGE